jgi:hypothetical protein
MLYHDVKLLVSTAIIYHLHAEGKVERSTSLRRLARLIQHLYLVGAGKDRQGHIGGSRKASQSETKGRKEKKGVSIQHRSHIGQVYDSSFAEVWK